MGTPQKPEYVLFISNCNYSMNFLNKLQMKEELFKKFNIVDINKIPTIPNEIEEVPCVYDGKNLYQGKDAFSWLNEKSLEYVSAANDGLMYSFLNGNEEKVFGNYSLLGQQNGSYGMGDPPPSNPDPTRMGMMNNNENKNDKSSLEGLMALRSNEMKSFGKN